MGFLDKAKALANEAADAGKRVANVVSDHVDELALKDDRVGKLVNQTKDVTKHGIEVAQQKSEDLAETTSGQTAGRAIRKIGQVVNNLPVFSATADAIRSKNCVDLLLERYRTDPTNPYFNLWLAESLIKTSQDMNKYQYAKGAIDPSSFLIAGAMQHTAQFGKNSLPTSEKLLRRAWSLSSSSLKSNLRSSCSFDVLARVYLAKGDIERAISTAKASVLADPKNPNARLTLGRALLVQGNFADAQRVGMAAVAVGSTLGYLLVAESTQLKSREGNLISLSDRVQQYEETVAKISPRDRESYNGAFRDSKEVFQATKNSQSEKIGSTWTTAKRWGGIIRDA
jgi:tetratricopeptide (TPR) repeat protein